MPDIGDIVIKTFEHHECGTEKSLKKVNEKAKDYFYKILYESRSLINVIKEANKLGYCTGVFNQTYHDGQNAHFKLGKADEEGFARITSETINKEIIFKLYIPLLRSEVPDLKKVEEVYQSNIISSAINGVFRVH